jgi:ABC-type phosphate transport system substrate-binding protein
MNPYHPIRIKVILILAAAVIGCPLQEWISIPAVADENPVIIIASPDVFESTLSQKDIRDIFLGKKRKWTDGKEIVLAVMYQTEIHEKFTEQYTRKTSTQFMTYWKHMVFVGQGRFPKSISTEEEMIDYVENASGVIGYVSHLPADGKRVKQISLSD